MKPIKKEKITITEYWDCNVAGCQIMHKTKKTALACIERDNVKQKNNKLLNKQRKDYINSLISDGVKLDDLKLSEFLKKASIRTRHCLRALEDITITDFLKIPEKQLLKRKNFGKKGLFEILNLIRLIPKTDQ